MQTILLSIIGCLSFLPADFPIQLIPSQLEVIEYQKGQVIVNKTLNTSQQFIAYFEKNKKGWYSSCVSYAPHYVLSSPQIQINISEEKVIVNYRHEKESYQQITKTVDTDELKKIIEQHQ